MNSVELGKQNIDYDLKRSNRKSLGITVNAKGQLIITAPNYITLHKIEETLKKSKKWIISKIEEKSNNLQIQSKRQFVSGESTYLFGKQYYLKIIESTDLHVEKDGDVLSFYVKNEDQAERVVTEWLNKEFHKKIKVMTSGCFAKFKILYPNTKIPMFKIRQMKKRWGSCSHDGTILLNSRLVTASPDCIEYVIYHELSHLLYSDHNKDFFRVLKTVYPNYKAVKKRLDQETVFFDD